MAESSPEFRKLGPEHLEACTRLYVDVFNGPPWNDHWTLETAGQRLHDLLRTPGFFGLVALRDGQPIAFAAGQCEPWQERTVYFLKEMCVRADQQGQGVGTALLGELEHSLQVERNVASTYLLTMRGDRTETFYARNGYRPSQRMILMSHWLGCGVTR